MFHLSPSRVRFMLSPLTRRKSLLSHIPRMVSTNNAVVGYLSSFSPKVPPQQEVFWIQRRSFSDVSEDSFDSDDSSTPPLQPPPKLKREIVQGVQRTVFLYLRHGMGRQRLLELKDNESLPLVVKWQRCMEIYHAVQCHALSGLGYQPDERGLKLYHDQVIAYVQKGKGNGNEIGDVMAEPEIPDYLRKSNRDAWRTVVCTGFGIKSDSIQEISIEKARTITEQISKKIIDPAILDTVRKESHTIKATTTDFQESVVLRHHLLQEVLLQLVYMGEDSKILRRHGFEPTEDGYIQLQLSLSEHHHDTQIAQLNERAMIEILRAAGLVEDAS